MGVIGWLFGLAFVLYFAAVLLGLFGATVQTIGWAVVIGFSLVALIMLMQELKRLYHQRKTDLAEKKRGDAIRAANDARHRAEAAQLAEIQQKAQAGSKGV